MHKIDHSSNISFIGKDPDQWRRRYRNTSRSDQRIQSADKTTDRAGMVVVKYVLNIEEKAHSNGVACTLISKRGYKDVDHGRRIPLI